MAWLEYNSLSLQIEELRQFPLVLFLDISLSMRRKQAELCGGCSSYRVLNNLFGFKYENVVAVCLNVRCINHHTWRGLKDVMSFIYLLGLTTAQERARKGNESDKLNANRSRTWIPRRAFITFLYCGCFFSFGTTMAILGPTLIELGHLVHHGLDMMSWLFFTQAAYALLGASVAGIVLDR